MRIALLALLILASLPAVASAEPYPKEVKDAFMKECIGGGGPPKTCECTLQKLEGSVSLADLAAQNIPEETINTYVADCLAQTGDLAAAFAEGLTQPDKAAPTADKIAPTDKAAPVTAPTVFGPGCKAYFQAANDFCADASVPDLYKSACPQWIESLKQMETVLSVPGVTQDVINSMEPGCQAGADGIKQSRDAIKAATP
jgi:hypothetical protein